MIINILGKTHPGFKLPFYESLVPAGFPSPADDYLERQLDLHDLLVEHPEATFFVRVEGDSMMGAGMRSGDVLIVDRSLKAAHGKIVVALLNGEFTVKRLIFKGDKIHLAAENPRFPPLEITEESDFQVWGVVTYVIHRAR
ncbi:MAG: translesion error-prone DNA polymerase V autoproteolytic subunit [Chlamydiales bacterium]|nr:translesion error-prone DNA polymerase V autoproteolytic subunit [Chlamydiales bacterium]